MRARILAAAAALLVVGAGAARANMTLYDNKNFGGDSRVITGDYADLSTIGWNDKAGSVTIDSGGWMLFRNKNFEGQSVTLGPGEYPNLEAVGLGVNKLSSIREVAEPGSDTGGQSGGDTGGPAGDTGSTDGGTAPPPTAVSQLAGCPAGQIRGFVPGPVGVGCMPVAQAPRGPISNLSLETCIDAGSNQAGHLVRLRPCAGTRQQAFAVAMKAGVTDAFMFFIYGDKCLSAAGGVANGARLELAVCNGGDGQMWVSAGAHGIALRTPAGTPLCLDAVRAGSGEHNPALGVCAQDAPRQGWRLGASARGGQL
jgi:hypothetical protein